MMRQTVTLYRRLGGQPVGWQRQVLWGVFFREAAGTALSEQGVQGGQLESLLLIPAGISQAPKPGDCVIGGVGPEGDFSGDIREHIPGCRMVTGIIRRGYGSSLDHWEVTLR